MRIPNVLLACILGPFLTVFLIRVLSTFGGSEVVTLNQGQVVLLTIFTLIGVVFCYVFLDIEGKKMGSTYVRIPEPIAKHFREPEE